MRNFGKTPAPNPATDVAMVREQTLALTNQIKDALDGLEDLLQTLPEGGVRSERDDSQESP